VIGFQLSAIKSLLDEQNASALRETFIAVLGHDLRTPLASIVGGASLLRKETLSERAQLKSLRRPKRPLHVSDV
jgi:signal transduction histidine kinase